MYYKVRVVQGDFRYRKVVKVIAQALELFSRNPLILLRGYTPIGFLTFLKTYSYITGLYYPAVYKRTGRLDNGEILLAAML